MTTRIQTIALIVALALVAVVVWWGSTHRVQQSATPATTIAFSCDGAKGIIATFYEGSTTPATSPDLPPTPGGSVALALSDGRSLTLRQTISADGARYASADDSFVFWGKGNGALVLEGGKEQSYIGCIVIAPASDALPLVFSNKSAGFSVRLPADYSADLSYRYQELGKGKEIEGIKFTIAPSIATGTNLAADTYVSVERIPQKDATATSCSAGLFLDPSVKPQTVTDGNLTYSVGATMGAGAGNRYEQVVYAIPGTNPCVGFRYFIHYSVFENYPAGAVKQFDEAALITTFDAIRHTLILAL